MKRNPILDRTFRFQSKEKGIYLKLYESRFGKINLILYLFTLTEVYENYGYLFVVFYIQRIFHFLLRLSVLVTHGNEVYLAYRIKFKHEWKFNKFLMYFKSRETCKYRWVLEMKYIK